MSARGDAVPSDLPGVEQDHPDRFVLVTDHTHRGRAYLSLAFGTTLLGGSLVMLLGLGLLRGRSFSHTSAMVPWAQLGCLLVSLLLVGVVVGAGQLLAMQHRRLIVTPKGARLTGLLAPAIATNGPVVLEGLVGDPQVLRMGDAAVRAFHVQPQGPGWTHERVSWLGARVAQLLGAALDDRRSAEAWARWTTDPVFRSVAALQAQVRVSKQEHPAAYRAEPWPAAHEVDVDGLRLDVHGVSVWVASRWLEVGEERLPLASLAYVGVLFRSTTRGLLDWEVRGVRDGAPEVLLRGDEDVLSPAQVRWLVDRIREAVLQQGGDPGTSEDVPEALQRLRSSE